jgi:hypothetical protein
MASIYFYYTKSVLEQVSYDPVLFFKELKTAVQKLVPFELQKLKKWLQTYTKEKPDLKRCLFIV